MELEKQCSKCKKFFPLTTEHFGPSKQNRRGFNSQCRGCRKDVNRKYRLSKKGKERIKKYRSSINGHLRCVYRDIKKRCNNPKVSGYKNYGGRGIKLCFTSNEFVYYVINIMKVDPRGLQIDRIDNDGNYEKGNIRFVTRSENNFNRRKKNGDKSEKQSREK